MSNNRRGFTIVSYKLYGLLLEEIYERTGTGKKSVFKKFIHQKLKDHFGIETLTELSEPELWGYITEIKALYAEQFGLILREPGETDINPTMRKLLENANHNYKSWKDGNNQNQSTA